MKKNIFLLHIVLTCSLFGAAEMGPVGTMVKRLRGKLTAVKEVSFTICAEDDEKITRDFALTKGTIVLNSTGNKCTLDALQGRAVTVVFTDPNIAVEVRGIAEPEGPESSLPEEE